MFSCPNCVNQKFNKFDNYVEHLKVVHKFTNFHIYLCGRKDCRKKIPTLIKLKEHEVQEHSVSDFNNMKKNNIDKTVLPLNVDIKNMLQKESSDVVAIFYHNHALPRSAVMDVLKEINKLLTGQAFSAAFDKILCIIKTCHPSAYLEIKELLSMLQTPFDTISNELHVVKSISDYYVEPKTVVIAQKLV